MGFCAAARGRSRAERNDATTPGDGSSEGAGSASSSRDVRDEILVFPGDTGAIARARRTVSVAFARVARLDVASARRGREKGRARKRGRKGVRGWCRGG